MAPRLQLQALLETICPNVYFQPPANLGIVYPAIVYRRSPGDHQYADNKLYAYKQQYEVTFISRDPDTDAIKMQILAIPYSKHDVFFVADDLNHDVFSIYF